MLVIRGWTLKSWWDYIFMRTCILFLHFIAPFSVLYCFARPLLHLRLPLHPHLQLWLALEAAFYLLVYLPLNAHLQKPAHHPAANPLEDRQELFRRCLRSIPDPERYLTKWFRDAPVDQIRHENVKDFYRWAFFYADPPNKATEEEVEGYVCDMEKLLGRRFAPGYGRAKPMRLTLDRVDMLHRSLTWYLCIFIVDTLTSLYLWWLSFSLYRTSSLLWPPVFPMRPFSLLASGCSPSNTLTYWHRPHTSKTRLPVLFIHGIGVGLYPYVSFLADVNTQRGIVENEKDGQVGIIAIEIMAISSRITAAALMQDDICEEIRRILELHQWGRFVLVSHSYGSVVVTNLLRTPAIAPNIGPILFIDPVSFLLHLPDVAYNFTHRRPARTKEYQLSYFGSKDIGTAHTLFRRFFWTRKILWKEDIINYRVAVALSGRDSIVDTKTIRSYLTNEDESTLDTTDRKEGSYHRERSLEVLWFEDLDHGQVFNEENTRHKLIDIVRRFCND